MSTKWKQWLRRVTVALGIIVLTILVFFRFDVRILSGVDIVYDSSVEPQEFPLHYYSADPILVEDEIKTVITAKTSTRGYVGRGEHYKTSYLGPTFVVFRSGRVLLTSGAILERRAGAYVLYPQ